MNVSWCRRNPHLASIPRGIPRRTPAPGNAERGPRRSFTCVWSCLLFVLVPVPARPRHPSPFLLPLSPQTAEPGLWVRPSGRKQLPAAFPAQRSWASRGRTRALPTRLGSSWVCPVGAGLASSRHFLLTVAPWDTTCLSLPNPRASPRRGGDSQPRRQGGSHLCQRPATLHEGEAGGCPASFSRRSAGPCTLGSLRDPEKRRGRGEGHGWVAPATAAAPVPWALGLPPPRDRPSVWHGEVAWHVPCPHFLAWSRGGGGAGGARGRCTFSGHHILGHFGGGAARGRDKWFRSRQPPFRQRTPGKRMFSSKTNADVPRFNHIYRNFLRPAEDSVPGGLDGFKPSLQTLWS